ncbi:MAG: NRDE family protein [Thermodesulfobacteriota bacterium]|nr:NRDE family protein [Thermodesulfobacteriota bacterium]
MCLIFIAYRYVPGYPLIIAGNRDEFYDRPTAPLDFWPEHPHVAGGVDKQAGGTWLGITREGKFAAITNFRDPGALCSGTPSRGALVRNYLIGNQQPAGYLETISENADQYNGFNLIAGDKTGIFYYSNMEGQVRSIPAGLHGLSNHLLNTPWPKVTKGKQAMDRVLQKEPLGVEAILQVLQDTTRPPDTDLPDTGVGLAWERMLSPMFIESEIYGTRSSSVILMDDEGQVNFTERTFAPDGKGGGRGNTRQVSFQLASGE